MTNSQALVTPTNRVFSTFSARATSLGAVVSLFIILSATALIWPVETLGYTAGISNEILAVSPGSAAEKAGLRVGDRIHMLYNRSAREAHTSVYNIVDLLGAHTVPVVVQRDQQIITTEMERRPPKASFQAAKLSMFLLALLCWGTGCFIGVVRHHTFIGSPLLATHWLCMASVVGSLMFTLYAAYPIHTLLVWLIIAFLAPLSIYIHLWFPLPPLLPSEIRRARRFAAYLFSSSALLNGALALWVVHRGVSMFEFAALLLHLAPITVVIALAGSGIFLHRAYRKTISAPTRRQVRLIMAACLTVLLVWILALITPVLIPEIPTIHRDGLILLIGLIPLAYLLCARVTDLYRLDRFAIRGLVLLTTATGFGLILTAGSELLNLSRGARVVAVIAAFSALYWPVQQRLLQLLPASFGTQGAQALDRAIQGLMTTLDTHEQITTLLDGARAQFAQPHLAFFVADVADSNTLSLAYQERMDFAPDRITVGPLAQLLTEVRPVTPSSVLQQQAALLELTEQEAQLVTDPGIALWCPIRHMQGRLLGLLLLGMRSDFDRYREADHQALHRLQLAASIAFAHSTAYTQIQRNEAEIRQLYQDKQTGRDNAAVELVRKIHDQVINGGVQQNVAALTKIVRQLQNNELRDLLTPVLEREQHSLYKLRRISDELHPTSIDDPLGLPIVLQNEVVRQQETWVTWEGWCHVEISGPEVPLSDRARWEAYRITSEAITNVIKHADATMIMIHLRYPAEPGKPVQLTIRDNGRNARVIANRDGHRGMRYMQESARAAGGTLEVHVEPHQCTAIIFTFPAEFSVAELS